jgi:hypothetical protein
MAGVSWSVDEEDKKKKLGMTAAASYRRKAIG